MAKFSLTKRELASGELPLLCMVCGNTSIKPVNKLLMFRPGNVLAGLVVCGFVGTGLLATGITQVGAFRFVFSVFGFIAFFALRRQIVKIPTRLPMCDKHNDQRIIPLRSGIAIESVDGENVMLTNISGEFIEALTEQRKNAPVPVVEDIAVDPVYGFAELPDDKESWRNIDMSD